MSVPLNHKPKTVDEMLNEIDYKSLNDGSYTPSKFALKFMNFIKLVNGKQGESSLTPVVHLKMLDKIISPKNRVANLCARGMAKTTLMFEYFILYVAVFGGIDEFGEISGMIYVSDSMDNGVKSARKNIEFRYHNSEFLQEWLPEAKFTDNFISFTNKNGHRLSCKMFGAKTGLRGTKIDGKRPTLAILDDLVSDDDAKSKTAMDSIKDTLYKGVDYALDPKKRKIIFNGTPFNKNDVLYEAVESGEWEVNVWPICEKFPCSREEFSGAWEDRFTYDFIYDQYKMSVNSGKLAAFNQELMLRISSEEERLVQDSEIENMWYPRAKLLNNRGRYNFYITTDFATKADQKNDNSVISVWAYNANGDWFWVDGIVKRQTMDKNIEDLFRLVSEYRPQQVGIESSGQQGAFIDWIRTKMLDYNIWFNFASSKGNTPGINPLQNKLARFNQVLPLIKANKIFFPQEMKTSPEMAQFVSELQLVTVNGIKSKHDDCIDTISMLMYLKPWKPTEDVGMSKVEDRWEDDDDDFHSKGASNLSSYIV